MGVNCTAVDWRTNLVTARLTSDTFDKLTTFVTTLQMELKCENGLCPSPVVFVASLGPSVTVTTPRIAVTEVGKMEAGAGYPTFLKRWTLLKTMKC